MFSEERVAWPFYIVCDVSQSMHRKRGNEITPFEAMQEALLELVDFAEDNVQVADIAHIGLVTFADDPEVVLPLRKMSDGVGIGQLPKGTYTDYVKVFTMLSDVVGTDIGRLENCNLKVKRPAVFFITDGCPEIGGRPQSLQLWQPPLSRLHALTATRPAGPGVPIAVVALGFANADCWNLRLIAQKPGVACIAGSGAANPHELIFELITSILDSVSHSTQAADLVFIPPRGMKLCG